MGWLIMNKEVGECNDSCAICKQPIIGGQKFYYADKGKVTHAICEWEQEDKINK